MSLSNALQSSQNSHSPPADHVSLTSHMNLPCQQLRSLTAMIMVAAAARFNLLHILLSGCFLPLLISSILLASASTASSAPLAASFVFGDSLVDAGNNDYIPLAGAKANNPPYGIDFPTPNANHTTGRFTNGLTIPDIIGKELGAPNFAPPFLAPTTKGPVILRGVNYASGGGGILNDTGRNFIKRLSMDMQIDYFEQTKQEIISMLGNEAATSLISNAIVSVTMGANDFLNNYLFPIPETKERVLPPEDFIPKLISLYRGQLTRLYEVGVRKLIVVNVPPLGCTPYQRTLGLRFDNSCAARPNDLASSFNSLLKDLIVELNANHPGAMFVYADAYGAATDVINNYRAYGFEDVSKACCGAGGQYHGLIPCRSSFTPCPDRSKYFFFDPYHSTQAVNQIIADGLLRGSKYTYPINIEQLAALNLS